MQSVWPILLYLCLDFKDIRSPGGVLPYQEVGGGGGGGLDLTSSLEAKFGAMSSQVHQIRRRSLEVLLPQKAKGRKKSQFWSILGSYLKFREQNLGLQQEFWRFKFWGQAPWPPNMEVPPPGSDSRIRYDSTSLHGIAADKSHHDAI